MMLNATQQNNLLRNRVTYPEDAHGFHLNDSYDTSLLYTVEKNAFVNSYLFFFILGSFAPTKPTKDCEACLSNLSTHH